MHDVLCTVLLPQELQLQVGGGTCIVHCGASALPPSYYATQQNTSHSGGRRPDTDCPSAEQAAVCQSREGMEVGRGRLPSLEVSHPVIEWVRPPKPGRATLSLDFPSSCSVGLAGKNSLYRKGILNKRQTAGGEGAVTWLNAQCVSTGRNMSENDVVWNPFPH